MNNHVIILIRSTVEAKNLKTNLHYNLILTTFLRRYKPVICNKNPTFGKAYNNRAKV
jgi:hypothetical protein